MKPEAKSHTAAAPRDDIVEARIFELRLQEEKRKAEAKAKYLEERALAEQLDRVRSFCDWGRVHRSQKV